MTIAFGEERKTREASSEEELDGQDAVDLADKGHADVDGGFGHRAAELRTLLESPGFSGEHVWTHLEIIGNVVIFFSWSSVAAFGHTWARSLVVWRGLSVVLRIERIALGRRLVFSGRRHSGGS